MIYTLLIGGAAGQGIDTTSALLEWQLKKAGYAVLTSRDFMSRIRGGHNFILLRFGDEVIESADMALDGLIVLNEESLRLHRDSLKPDGFILCDTDIESDDPRTIQLPMADMAKELGNPRVAGSIANGVILKLFGLDLDYSEVVLRQQVKDQYIEINQTAMREGYDAVEQRYDRLNADFAGHMLVSGNQAVALGALAAGLRFYSAYPMSPSTGIMEYLAGQSKNCDLVVEQAEDEIAAINMALGASFAGVPAMTGTSGGGFALMVEALGLAGIAELPIVIADVQRPGPATGLPTRTEQSDLKFVISAAQGEFPRMVIALRDQADAYEQTIRAFKIAERYQIPVILLSDQYLGDGTKSVPPFVIPDDEPVKTTEVETPYLRYRLTEDGVSPRLHPGQTGHLVTSDSDEHDEQGMITESADMRNLMMEKRMGKLDHLRTELLEPEFTGDDACDVLLLAWGSTAGPVRRAVSELNQGDGSRYGALLFGDVFPLPVQELMKRAPRAKTVINVEQNYTGQLAGLVRESCGIACDRSVLKYDGRQITAAELIQKLSEEA
ncbi:MAG: 2-oxoacid:acceptor oxidoreductase subunit alpha [Eubacteriales bacterium]|nr:2-oxoacid:acceptor oxidoreductase subunit alpha [Eubacteriales bacterium]